SFIRFARNLTKPVGAEIGGLTSPAGKCPRAPIPSLVAGSRLLIICCGPLRFPRTGFSHGSTPLAAPTAYAAPRRPSYLGCRRRRKRRRTRLSPGLQYIPDFFFQSAAVGTLRIGAAAMRGDETTA